MIKTRSRGCPGINFEYLMFMCMTFISESNRGLRGRLGGLFTRISTVYSGQWSPIIFVVRSEEYTINSAGYRKIIEVDTIL